MSTLKAYTFKYTDTMQKAMEAVMDEWYLDRTSVIRLALYMLVSYLNQESTRRMNLHELVAELERLAPPHYPTYAQFCSGTGRKAR